MIDQHEARSRLISTLSVCENEVGGLIRLCDPRLDLIIDKMLEFNRDLLAALEGIDYVDAQRNGLLPNVTIGTTC